MLFLSPVLNINLNHSTSIMASYTARYPTDRPDGNMPQRRAGIAAPSTLAGLMDNLWTTFNNFNVLLLPRRIHFFELEDLEM